MNFACQLVARSNVHGWLDPLSGGLGSHLMFLKQQRGLSGSGGTS